MSQPHPAVDSINDDPQDHVSSLCKKYQDPFYTHFNTHYAQSGHDYTYYEPAYHFGCGLASAPQYREYEWYQIDPAIQTRWEEANPDTWATFRDAVRYAWDVVRGNA